MVSTSGSLLRGALVTSMQSMKFAHVVPSALPQADRDVRPEVRVLAARFPVVAVRVILPERLELSHERSLLEKPNVILDEPRARLARVLDSDIRARNGVGARALNYSTTRNGLRKSIARIRRFDFTRLFKIISRLSKVIDCVIHFRI